MASWYNICIFIPLLKLLIVNAFGNKIVYRIVLGFEQHYPIFCGIMLSFLCIFLGRYTAQDIAVFARDTFTSKVFTLGPENFPNPVTTGEDNWFVDFFAPVRLIYDVKMLGLWEGMSILSRQNIEEFSFFLQ